MQRPAKLWTRDELLIAFNLYCRTPFGRLHRGNPDIIAMAELLGRTPSSVSMKLCNFARGRGQNQGAKQVDAGRSSTALVRPGRIGTRP